MGKGIPGSFVTIDDDGNEVPPQTKGNIAVPVPI